MPTRKDKFGNLIYDNSDLAKYESQVQGPNLPEAPVKRSFTLDTLAEAQESEASRRARGLGEPSGYTKAADIYGQAEKLANTPGTKVSRIKALLGVAGGLEDMQYKREVGEVGNMATAAREREMQTLRDIEQQKIYLGDEKNLANLALGEEKLNRAGDRSGYLAGMLEERRRANDIQSLLADYTVGEKSPDAMIVDLNKAKADILKKEGAGSESTWFGLGGPDDVFSRIKAIDDSIKSLEAVRKNPSGGKKKKEWENYKGAAQ